MCDEPTGNLDTDTGKQIVEIFQRLHDDEGLTVVAVTHEHQLADVAQRVIRLKSGRIVDDEEAA